MRNRRPNQYAKQRLSERPHLTKTTLFWQDPVMTIKTALETAHARLAKLNLPTDASWSETEILLAHALKQERTWLIAHAEDPLPPSKEKAFFKLITRRETHEPIAYLTGTKEFRGLSFQVNKHVLIPRPETEEMIDIVGATFMSPEATDGKDRMNPAPTTIWDAGTGSGAIAVSAKHAFPHTTVIASDINKRALHVAEKNAEQLLGKHHDIQFIQGALLTKKIQTIIANKHPHTLIVLANLPYLPLSDRQVLQKDVVDFEPSQALFTEEEGNTLILKLFRQLQTFIKKQPTNLLALFEFDPPQAKTLQEYAQQIFTDALLTVHKDSCGRPRFLEIKLFRHRHPAD